MEVGFSKNALEVDFPKNALEVKVDMPDTALELGIAMHSNGLPDRTNRQVSETL